MEVSEGKLIATFLIAIGDSEGIREFKLIKVA